MTLPIDQKLNMKSTGGAAGLFYEHLTSQALGLDFEEHGPWDLTSPEGDRIEVKSTRQRQWKVRNHQITEYVLRETTFILWKWRWSDTYHGTPTDDLKTFHKLWKWLSWNTLYGLVVPGLFLEQLLKSKNRSVRRYRPPGRWSSYVVASTGLFKLLTRFDKPKLKGVPTWSIVESKVKGVPVFGHTPFTTHARLYWIKPAEELDTEEIPF